MTTQALVLRRALDVAHHLNDVTPPWSDVLTTARDVVGSDWATLIMFDSAGTLLHFSQVGMPDCAAQEYDRHYHAVDTVRHDTFGIPPGTWFDTEQRYSNSQRSGDEFFGDFGVRHRMAQINAFFFGVPPIHAAISFQRSRADPRAMERLARPGPAALFRTLQTELARRQSNFAQELLGVSTLLASFDEAACLLTVGGCPVLASPLATELLAQAGIATKRGRLWHGDARLLNYVFDRLRSVFRQSKAVSLCLPTGWGSLLRIDLTRSADRLRIATEPIVLARLSRKSLFVEHDEERLRMAFGISPAEAHILAGLVGGGRVADLATTGGVSVETVRRQIKTMMAKMQCTSQTELVKLAMLSLR